MKVKDGHDLEALGKIEIVEKYRYNCLLTTTAAGIISRKILAESILD